MFHNYLFVSGFHRKHQRANLEEEKNLRPADCSCIKSKSGHHIALSVAHIHNLIVEMDYAIKIGCYQEEGGGVGFMIIKKL